MTALALIASKGGVGKTTLAVHLAALAGPGTLLVDLDPQRSAADWYQTRSAFFPELATGDPRDLPPVLKALQPGAWAIIDTAPHALEATEIIAPNVSLVLIPTQPSILDLRAIARTVGVVKRSGARAAIVLNRVPPGRGDAEASTTTDARRVLQEYGLPVCPVALGQRAVLQHALNDGRAVTEFDPHSRAADELRQLWKWITDHAAQS